MNVETTHLFYQVICQSTVAQIQETCSQSLEESFMLESHGFKEFSLSLCCVLSHVQLFCNPLDCSLPVSSTHGICQARILEWVAIFS